MRRDARSFGGSNLKLASISALVVERVGALGATWAWFSLPVFVSACAPIHSFMAAARNRRQNPYA